MTGVQETYVLHTKPLQYRQIYDFKHEVLTYLLTYLLTYRIFFGKLIFTQLVKQQPAFFMKLEGLLPCSKKPTIGPILSQLNAVRLIDPCLPKVHFNFILPHMPRYSRWSLPFGPPNQDPVNTLPSSMRATCPAHLILLDLINLKIFGEKYRL
jgi:hypothetical protein